MSSDYRAVVGRRATSNGKCDKVVIDNEGNAKRCLRPGTHYLRLKGQTTKRPLCEQHHDEYLKQDGIIADPKDRHRTAQSWREHRASISRMRYPTTRLP